MYCIIHYSMYNSGSIVVYGNYIDSIMMNYNFNIIEYNFKVKQRIL